MYFNVHWINVCLVELELNVNNVKKDMDLMMETVNLVGTIVNYVILSLIAICVMKITPYWKIKNKIASSVLLNVLMSKIVISVLIKGFVKAVLKVTE